MSSRAEQVLVDLGQRSYTVYIAPDLLANKESSGLTPLSRFVQGKRALLVTDSNLANLYAEQVLTMIRSAGASFAAIHTIPAGEEEKTFTTVEGICRKAAQSGLDRHSVILSLGGGVTSDLAGFAASIYMRGIDFISIPSSLLAMIDAGIGGKTGADLPEGKNLIGTFWQPKTVLMDVTFLKSLPLSEIRCGCAELVKHAILFDADLFQLLEETIDDLMVLKDPEQAARIIARSCHLKAVVVSNDEREGGRRALLNFGHSFGHAIEKLLHFRMSHGDAVSIGMAMASTLAVDLRLMKENDAIRIRKLLTACGLPLNCHDLKADDILEAMRGDKKNKNGKLRLIIPRGIGKAEIQEDIQEDRILNAIGVHCD